MTRLSARVDSARPAAMPGTKTAAKPNWIEEIRRTIESELMQRGQERYYLHGAVCDGRAG